MGLAEPSTAAAAASEMEYILFDLAGLAKSRNNCM